MQARFLFIYTRHIHTGITSEWKERSKKKLKNRIMFTESGKLHLLIMDAWNVLFTGPLFLYQRMFFVRSSNKIAFITTQKRFKPVQRKCQAQLQYIRLPSMKSNYYCFIHLKFAYTTCSINYVVISNLFTGWIFRNDKKSALHVGNYCWDLCRNYLFFRKNKLKLRYLIQNLFKSYLEFYGKTGRLQHKSQP